MENEFFEFLKSSKMLCSFSYGDDCKMIILKVKCTDKIDILYSLSGQKDKLFDLHSPFVYSGIYDREKDKLYDTEYSIRRKILNWEYNDEKNISASDLYKIISDDVNKRIKELVNAKKNDIFNIKGAELGNPLYAHDVIKEFINGKTSNNLNDEYIQYHTEKPSAIIDYLTDKKSFLEDEANTFIHKNSLSILKGLAISEEKRKVLKEIEENKEHAYHKIKSIIDAVKSNNCITVNLTIYKNDKELTFKYDAAALINAYTSFYLSTWSIENAKERNLYERTFGDDDFYYDDIVKITYGKKIIYEDNNFKSEEIRDEMCL